MRTVRIKIYKFNELSEASQKKAISNLWDINVDYSWWEFIYEDAASIGLKITEFDRANYCKGELMHSLTEVCDLITANHGEECETFKTAKLYRNEWNKLVEEHSDGINKNKVCEDKGYDFDKLADELEKQFRLSLCEDYRIILQKEHKFRTSEQAIKETIISSAYDFTADGKMYH